MQEMSVLVILLSFYFVGFISGFGTRAIISQHRRYKARAAHYAAQVDRSSAHRAVSTQPSEKDSSTGLLTRFAPHTLALSPKGRSTP